MPQDTPLHRPQDDAWLADFLGYEGLSAEQKAVLQHLLEDPEREAALEDVQALEPFLRGAVAAPDDALLWRHLCECAGLSPLPDAPLTPAEQRWVQLQLAYNPEWKAHWRTLEEEFRQQIDWHVASTVAQPSKMAAKPVPEDRPPVSKDRASRNHLRTVALGVLVVAALYGVPWLISWLTLSQAYSLASLDPYQEEIELIVSRRGVSDIPQEFNDLAAEGLSALNAAPQSTLGLFPGYDREQAKAAIAHLNRAYEQANNLPQQAEATFFLAKAHVMVGQMQQARQAYQRVIQIGSPDYTSAAEAELQRLDAAGF